MRGKEGEAVKEKEGGRRKRRDRKIKEKREKGKK